MNAFKKFLLGLVVGIVVAFPLGINFGRGAALLSNPFVKPEIQKKVKAQAESIVEDTKNAIHDATKPMRNAAPPTR
jgi:hypothetical protein